VDRATLERALVKLRSDFYSNLESLNGFGRADLLACFALFDDDPNRINTILGEFARVTPEQVQRAAQEWLRPTNRTIVQVLPGAQMAPEGAPARGN
jgi:predicted Zn-dependent peptidase